MKSYNRQMLEDLEKQLPKNRAGIPVNITDIHNDELDKYDDIEEWMSDDLKERLIEYWDLRDSAIEYQVFQVLCEEDE